MMWLLATDIVRKPRSRRREAAAGTSAGWRLMEDGTRPRVALFEMSDRIGGRLHTVTPDGMPHLRAEVGGMRFLDTHLFVTSLASHLGLETGPFLEGDEHNLF